MKTAHGVEPLNERSAMSGFQLLCQSLNRFVYPLPCGLALAGFLPWWGAIIAAVCGGDGSGCIDAVKQQLAAAKGAGCGGGGICIAQGLADATSAINANNSALATSMAEAVAVNGAQCLQVAFGAVLDNNGTAAIQDTPPEAGSRG